MNRMYFIFIALLSMLYIVHEIRKKRFSIKESFWWMMASISMLLLSIFPYSINWFADKFGVEYPPSLLFVMCIIFLILMNFRNSKRISEQQMKITELAQNLAIIKRNEINEKRK